MPTLKSTEIIVPIEWEDQGQEAAYVAGFMAGEFRQASLQHEAQMRAAR